MIKIRMTMSMVVKVKKVIHIIIAIFGSRFLPAGMTKSKMTMSRVAEDEPIVRGEPELVD